MKRLIGFALIALALGCSTEQKTETPVIQNTSPTIVPSSLPTTVEEAVASNFRSESNRPRDQYRHPVETLNFFGVRPNMTVIEITPGNGWYLEILAPLLASQGHYIAAMPSETVQTDANAGTVKINDWKKNHTEVAAKITAVEFSPPAKVLLAPPESVDMILTFRNVHNWMAKGTEKAVLKGFIKALKPGGVLGIVEHRANPKQKRDPKAKSGYVREQDIIALAKSVGFKLDKTSEINANPKDTKNYPDGVWTLPPTLKLGDKDRERYLAIGESDRMTLRFFKPDR